MPPIPLRVLVVEDHADTRRYLELLFRRLGYPTRIAGSCESARAAFREDSAVDVVVSDVGLPDGDGITLLEELKLRYGVASVALTAHVMPADMQRYGRSNIDRCLPKPAGVDDLKSVLESIAAAGAHPSRRSA